MPTVPKRKRGALELIASRSKKHRATTFTTLVKRLGFSDEGACDCLSRLWRERLIKTVDYRKPRFKYRLEAEESIRELRFQITERGNERLKWYLEREMEDPWFLDVNLFE